MDQSSWTLCVDPALEQLWAPCLRTPLTHRQLKEEPRYGAKTLGSGKWEVLHVVTEEFDT